MNWERGLYRVILILSIIGAIWGMVSGYREATSNRFSHENPVQYMIGGAFLGFFGVWVAFVVLRWVAWPVYKWTVRGFREDKQKDGQKTNEVDQAGNC